MRFSSSRRRALLLGLGVILAIVAGWIAFTLGSQGQGGPSEVVTRSVLVAAREIPARTTVIAEDVTVRELPEDAVLPQSYSDPAAVIGRINSVPIITGQQITPNLFATTSADLPFSILEADEEVTPDSPYWRAVAVAVPKSRAVGGQIRAGQRIDLFATVEFGEGQQQVVDEETGQISYESVGGAALAVVDPVTGELIGVIAGRSTKIAFQDLKVLEVNEDEGLYILRVDLHQAEEIAHIEQVAPDSFGLALRPEEDTRVADTTEYGETTDRLIMQYSYPVPELVDLETLLGVRIVPIPASPAPDESPTPAAPSPEPSPTP